EMLGCGEPAFVAELQGRAADARVPGLLSIPGFVHRADLPARLARAHVFAAPSLYEGGPGFVYLEAMACGLPVIACSGSGAAEVVIPEHNGLLAPPGDLEALVTSLRWLMRNPGERERLGKNGRRYVVEHADSGQCLRRLEDFYGAVAARSRSEINVAVGA